MDDGRQALNKNGDRRGMGSKKNVGRKKKKPTKPVAVRLDVDLVDNYGIDSAWIMDAVKMKLLSLDSQDKVSV